MKDKDRGPILKLFCQLAPPLMQAQLARSSCLNATRILIDVMGLFGIKAEPLSVNLVIVNRIYRERFERLGRLPTGEELNAWFAEGAWALATDMGVGPSMRVFRARLQAGEDMLPTEVWPGHLVGHVQGWLVDASAAQFDRPEKQICVAPVVWGRTTPRFLRGRAAVVLETAEHAHLAYSVRVGDTTWAGLPGFLPHAENRALSYEIAGAIGEKIGRKVLGDLDNHH